MVSFEGSRACPADLFARAISRWDRNTQTENNPQRSRCCRNMDEATILLHTNSHILCLDWFRGTPPAAKPEGFRRPVRPEIDYRDLLRVMTVDLS